MRDIKTVLLQWSFLQQTLGGISQLRMPAMKGVQGETKSMMTTSDLTNPRFR